MTTIPSTLEGMRERLAERLVDRCVVELLSKDHTLNRVNGQVTEGDPTRVYPALASDDEDGPCLISPGPGLGTMTRTEGGTDVAVRSWLLRLPHTAAALAVQRGMRVRITSSENTQLLDHPMFVHAPDLRSTQVSVMLTLTERSYEP